jgi:hypothetical protein
MRRVLQGGVSVFQPTVRPNQFFQVGIDDVIQRHGEHAMWFRLQPCPCPPAERTADCNLCVDSHIRTFQETFLIEKEQPKGDGHWVFPRYHPARSVEKLSWRHEGQTTELTVDRVYPDKIQIKESMKDWAALLMDYHVDLIESNTFEIEVSNSQRVSPKFLGTDQNPEAAVPYYGVIVGVEELYFKGPTDTDFAPISALGTTLDSVILKARVTGTVRGRLRIFSPVPIAYHTLNAGTEKTEQSRIQAETGEMDIIVSQGYHMGEGDIVTFLETELRHSMYVEFRPGKVDRIMYSPVIRVHNCISKQKINGVWKFVHHHEGEDFVLSGADRITWLKPKPPGGYSIMYDYHPSYRVQPAGVETGGLQDRRLPRQFRVRKWSSFDGRE